MSPYNTSCKHKSKKKNYNGKDYSKYVQSFSSISKLELFFLHLNSTSMAQLMLNHSFIPKHALAAYTT